LSKKGTSKEAMEL